MQYKLGFIFTLVTWSDLHIAVESGRIILVLFGRECCYESSSALRLYLHRLLTSTFYLHPVI